MAKTIADLYRERSEAKMNGESKTKKTKTLKDLYVSKNIYSIGEEIASRTNTWLKNSNNYITNYRNRVKNRTGTYKDSYVADSATWLDTVTKQKNNFDAEATNIRGMLDEYGEYFDSEWVKNIRDAIDRGENNQNIILNSSTSDKDYWSQWEGEDAYNEWVSYEKDQEEKRNYDLYRARREMALLQEIINLREAADQETSSMEKGAKRLQHLQKMREYESMYGEIEGNATEHLANREKYYNEAKLLQESEAVLSADDFREYSQKGANIANPTLREAEGWLNVFGKPVGGKDVGNIVTYSRENADLIKMGVANGSPMVGDALYAHMKDEEVDIYNYYLAKEGEEKASAYLSSIYDTLVRREAGEMYERMEDKTALELTFGIVAGVDQFASGVRNNFLDDDKIQTSATQYASGMVREDLADDGFNLPEWLGGGSIAQAGYDVITSTSNMLPSMLVSSITGSPLAGASILGLSAAGNARAEMLSLGYGDSEARAYGAMVGASEAGLQYLLGGVSKLGGKLSNGVVKNILSKVDNAYARVALQLGGNMLSEGFEEGLQTVIEPWLKSLATGTDFEAPNIDEVLYSGLLGAVTSFGLEGGTTTANAVSTYVNGNTFKNSEGAVAHLVEAGKTFDVNSVAYKMANKVTSKTGAFTIGTLYNEIGASLSEQNINDIATALENTGMDKDTAMKLAKGFDAVVEGLDFNDQQKAALESNSVLAGVILNKLIDENLTSYQKNALYKAQLSKTNGLSDLSRGNLYDKGVSEAQDKVVQRTRDYTEVLRSIAKDKVSREQATPETKIKNSAHKDVATADVVSKDGKTILAETGEEVTIDKNNAVKRVEEKDGKRTVYYNTDKGEVSSTDIFYADDNEAILFESFTDLNPEIASAAIRHYDGSVPVQVYADGVREGILTYGSKNFQAVGKDISVNSALAKLSSLDQEFALDLGRRHAKLKAIADTKANEGRTVQTSIKPDKTGKKKVKFERGVSKSLTRKVQQHEIALAELVSNVFGMDIYLYDAQTKKEGENGYESNGYYDPSDGSIHLDIQALSGDKQAIAYTLSHELAHFIKDWSEEKYKIFADFLIKQYAEHGVPTSALLDAKMKKLGTDDVDFAFDELVADACEKMLLDSKAVEKVAELKVQDAGLVEKIKQFLTDLIAKIKKAYAKYGIDRASDEAQAVDRMTDVVEELRALFEDAAVDAAKNYQASIQNANNAVFGTDTVSEAHDFSVKNQLKENAKIGEAAIAYNDRHNKVNAAVLKVGVDTMMEMANTMLPYLDEEGILPPDLPGKTLFKNGSYGRTGENTTVCVRTLTYEDFKDRVADELGRPLTVAESLLVSQKIYDIATDPQCIYCYVAADRKAYDEYLGEYWKAMDKYVRAMRRGGDPEALYKEYLDGRKDTAQQQKRWAMWKSLAKSGKPYISAKDLATRANRDQILNDKNSPFAEQVRDAKRYAQSASWAKTVQDYRAYKGDILKMTQKLIDTLNSEYGLRMYSFSDYTPAFIVENMQMIIDASARGLKSLAYTKDTDYAKIFAPTGQAINVSCFARYDSKTGTYVEDNRQGASWSETKELRKKHRNVGAVMVCTNDAMVEWALKQDWIDVVIPYHIVKTGTTIANEYDWRNYTAESADRKGNRTANIYPTEHNNDFATYQKLLQEREITPRFERFYQKALSGELTTDQYMKLVNEVRLPASELAPVLPMFDLAEAKKSFGVNEDGSVIPGGFVDKGGYMGGWYRAGVDVSQEVLAVKKDIVEGKTSLDVDYGMNKKVKMKQIEINKGISKPIQNQAKLNNKGRYDPRTVTEDDVRGLLESADSMQLDDDTFIPVRIQTPPALIYWAKQKRNEVIDDYPVAMKVYKARQAMAVTDEYLRYDDTPHELTVDDVISIIEKMNDPLYIVYQESNERYVEVISHTNRQGKRVFAIVELGDEKNPDILNEYEGGIYNLLITTYSPKNGEVQKLLNNPKNQVIYNKEKGKSQGSYGRNWPLLLNDSPFYKDSIPQKDGSVKTIIGEKAKNIQNQLKEPTHRTILANALETTIDTSTPEGKYQLQYLTEYKGHIAEIEDLEDHLAEVKTELKELSFAKGKRNVARIDELQRDKNRTQIKLNKLDRRLTELDSMKPIRDLLAREKESARKEAEKAGRELAKERVAQDRERRSARIYKDRIEATVKSLRNRLVHPTAKTAIPEAFGKSVAKFLSTIDFSTYDKNGNVRVSNANYQRDLARESLEEISKQLEENSIESMYGQLDISPEMKEWISLMSDAFALHTDTNEVYSVNQMSVEQLKTLHKFLTSLQRSINNAAKYYTSASSNVASDAMSTMEYLKPLAKKAHYEKIEKIGKIFSWDYAQPVTVFDRLGTGGKHIYSMLVKGQSKMALNVKGIEDFVADLYTEEEAKAWQNDSVSVKIQDREYQVTPAMLMGLHCLLQQEDSARHILMGGGIRFADVTFKGKTTRHENSIFNEADAEEIESKLTDRQRQVAEAMRDYMAQTGSAWGNEISMTRFGYHAFTIAKYYPIRTIASGSEYEAQQKRANIYALLNKSFTKERNINADNAVIVDDIFSVFNNHMSEMALYNAWALPVIDTIKWFNFKVRQDIETGTPEQSVHDSLRLAYGKYADEYIRRLLESINSEAAGGLSESVAFNALRMVNRVQVAANIRVAVQQPFSVTRALEHIAPKYVTPLAGKAFTVARDEMLKHSGVALWKSLGYYDVDVSRPLEVKVKKNAKFADKVTEKTMFLAEKGDQFTWTILWNACKKESSAKNPGISEEELLEKTKERFHDLILRTQVIDSVLSKSQWMRSTGFFHRSTSAFMSEPMTSYNGLLRAYDKYARDAAMYGKKKSFQRNAKGILLSMGIFTLTQLVNALVTAPIDALRDDDDDEYYEKLLSNFGDNAVQNLLPTNMMPYVSDIVEYAIYGKTDRADLQIYTRAIDLGMSIYRTLTDYSHIRLHKTIESALSVASSFSGLPMYNVMRDAVSVWNTIASDNLKFRTSEPSNSVNDEKLYDAIISGNASKISRYKEKYKDEKEWNSAVASALKEHDPRIMEAAIALLEGDPSERIRIQKSVIAEGKFTQDQVITATNSLASSFKSYVTKATNAKLEGDTKEYNEIIDKLIEDGYTQDLIEEYIGQKEADYAENPPETDAETSMYQSSDIADAYDAGDNDLALKVIEDLIRVKTENGSAKTPEEREKSARSSVKALVTKYWKEKYKQAYANKDSEEMKRIRYILKDTGLYGTNSDIIDTCKRWLAEKE